MKEQRKKHKLFSMFVYDFAKVTAGIPGLIWHRPKIFYESENARKKVLGGALLIGNHVGFLDPIYMMYALWYRRHRFICLKEIAESKGGWFFRQFHCIPIDRENFGMDSFRLITDSLKNGDLVSMFPEGHISEGGGLQTFKSGMVLMALQSGVPIIPMYMEGREHWYQRFRMMVGDPVDVRSFYGDRPTFKQIEEITQLLFEKEQQLKQKLEQED